MKTSVRDYINGLNSVIRDCVHYFKEGVIPTNFDLSGLGRDNGIYLDHVREIGENIKRLLKDNGFDLLSYLYSLILDFNENPILNDLGQFEFEFTEPKTIQPLCYRIPEKGMYLKVKRLLEESQKDMNFDSSMDSREPLNSIAHVFLNCIGQIFMFANMIDGIMLEYGIDFVNIQEDCGIWLKPKDRMTHFDKRANDLQHLWNWNRTLAETRLRRLPRFQQGAKPTIPEKRGTNAFKDRINIKDNADGLLNLLHSLIDGKKGKNAALVLYCVMKMGYISLPTASEVVNEFDCGGEKGFNKYFHKGQLDTNLYSKSEIEGIETRLKSL